MRAPLTLPAIALAASALLGACETCEEPSPVASAQDPFAEVEAQGLSAYLGTIEPREVVVDGAQTHHQFAAADGPICLEGDDYWVATRTGSEDGLVIYLEDGGACWSEQCNATSTPGTPGVPDDGLLNPDLKVNAVADWNVAFLPYCDGSLFLGDTQTAGRFQRGLINLSAGLDVARASFPDADRIVLAGSSAGGYAAHVAVMLVRALWPDAAIVVVVDAGVGLGRPGDPSFIPGLLAEWNAAHLLPASCSDCVTDHITGLVEWELERDPNLRFAAISSYDDAVIAETFLQLPPGAYQAALRGELERLAAAHPGRYHRFLFAGDLHSTLTTDSQHIASQLGKLGSYDEVEVDGTSVAQWLGLLLEGCESFGDRIE